MKIEDQKKIFRKLKKNDWKKAAVSFYVVKRSLNQKKAKYDVMLVNIDTALKRTLRGITNKKIKDSNEVLEYDFNTADLDNNLLGIPSSETDFEEILKAINVSVNPPLAKDYEELLGTWLYIVRLDLKNLPPLFAIRYVVGGWTTKKVTQLINMVWKNNMLVDLDFKDIFRIDSKLDFFSFDNTIFIADKKNFETALNFRVGMEKNRDEIVKEFKKLKLFENPQDISELVGNNIRRLRRLSQVKKSEYYKDEKFMASLKKINKYRNWGIKYSKDGKLLFTDDDIDTVLLILDNGRLDSPINQEAFDVDVKRKVVSS